MSGKIEGLRVDDYTQSFRFSRIKGEVLVSDKELHDQLFAKLLGITITKSTSFDIVRTIVLKADPLAGAGMLSRFSNPDGGTKIMFARSSTSLRIPGRELSSSDLELIRLADETALRLAFPDENFVRGSVF